MAKKNVSASQYGSQVFLSSQAQSKLTSLQRQLSLVSDENFDKYTRKGGPSKVVVLALETLEKTLNSQG